MLFAGNHRHPGFIDLLCDAVFQLRLAVGSQDAFTGNRHSRASIMASAFSLECAANAVMSSVALSTKLGEDLDRLPLLSKFDVYLKFATPDKGLDRGDDRVSKIAELIGIRNEFVHPKVTEIDVELGALTDVGNSIAWPMEITPKVWPATQIPKPPMFWSAMHAESAFNAVTRFLAYFFSLSGADTSKVKELLFQRTDVALGETSVSIESIFDEFDAELDWAATRGFKLAFLGFEKKGRLP